MAKLKKIYICQQCGYESLKWMGKCPDCDTWNSLVEDISVSSSKANPVSLSSNQSQKAKPINEIQAQRESRILTDIDELDRVLGGGIVEGSLTLIGGDPGIGKSTIMLQVCKNLANNKKKVLYVSGEESLYQIKIRSERLGCENDNLLILSETDIHSINYHIEEIKPDILVIDSVQTMFAPEITSTPGSVSQVREITNHFMKIAKKLGICVFLIGHVTKDGSIAGPRLLEHMVDTVLYFEGDKNNIYRMIRAVKNRFGSTNELGIFQMTNEGLIEVENPSSFMISEKPVGQPGSVIATIMEGTRPMMVEIQALVAQSNFGLPKRMATGLDFNRVSLLIALLEKKVGLEIQAQDVYLNVVGGIKINEPAVDLASIIAIASGFKNRIFEDGCAIMGEVGLTGEVRAVSFIQKRVLECQKLGFDKVVVPYNNLCSLENIKGIKIHGVKNVREALNLVLGS